MNKAKRFVTKAYFDSLLDWARFEKINPLSDTEIEIGGIEYALFTDPEKRDKDEMVPVGGLKLRLSRNKEAVSSGVFIKNFIILKDGTRMSIRTNSIHWFGPSEPNEWGYGWVPRGEWLARLLVTVWDSDGRKIQRSMKLNGRMIFHKHDEIKKARPVSRKTVLRFVKKTLNDFRGR